MNTKLNIKIKLIGAFNLLLLVSIACSPAVTPTPVELLPVETAFVETVEPLVADGWARYSNSENVCQYSISFPDGMSVYDQGQYSETFGFAPADLNKPMTNFVYVSAIDQNVGFESIYNYNIADIEVLMSMGIGENKALHPDDSTAPWYTFHRLSDTTIAGHSALAFENVQPWEFPTGTKELRFIMILEGCTYQIGGYVDATASGAEGTITQELLDEIVSTISVGP